MNLQKMNSMNMYSSTNLGERENRVLAQNPNAYYTYDNTQQQVGSRSGNSDHSSAIRAIPINKQG
jgi:hypothetical protein